MQQVTQAVTNIETVTDLPATVTNTQTQTQTISTVVAGPTFSAVATYNTHCAAINYLTIRQDSVSTTYEAAFQTCAAACRGIPYPFF
jgi:hypothetical protein